MERREAIYAVDADAAAAPLLHAHAVSIFVMEKLVVRRESESKHCKRQEKMETEKEKKKMAIKKANWPIVSVS